MFGCDIPIENKNFEEWKKCGPCGKMMFKIQEISNRCINISRNCCQSSCWKMGNEQQVYVENVEEDTGQQPHFDLPEGEHSYTICTCETPKVGREKAMSWPYEAFSIKKGVVVDS